MANQPMESIDASPYRPSANKPMDLNAEDGGKLYKLTSLPNTPMDLGPLGTHPRAYFNTGGPKANQPMNTNPDYNPGLTANSPIYLGD